MGYAKIQNTGISSAQFSLEVEWYTEPTTWTESTPGHSKSVKNDRSADQIVFCTSGRKKYIYSKQLPMLIIQMIPIQNSM